MEEEGGARSEADGVDAGGVGGRAPTDDLIDDTALDAVAELALNRPANTASGPSQMNLSVLVVEDDHFQRLTLRQMFDRANVTNRGSVHFDVRLLESTSEALQFLRSEASSLDLVILDVVFPGEEMSGRDILPHIREAAGDKTAIVMLSAYSQPRLVEECIYAGADAYLPKPIRAEEVGLLWQHCLKRGGKRLPPNPDGRPSVLTARPAQVERPRCATRIESRPSHSISPSESTALLPSRSGLQPSSISLSTTSRVQQRTPRDEGIASCGTSPPEASTSEQRTLDATLRFERGETCDDGPSACAQQ